MPHANTIVAAAIDHLGGVKGAAAKLEVSVQLVYLWKAGKRKFPARLCPTLERLSQRKFLCEELRPDIEWSVLRPRAEVAA